MLWMVSWVRSDSGYVGIWVVGLRRGGLSGDRVFVLGVGVWIIYVLFYVGDI